MTSQVPDEKETVFQSFISEVKTIEEKDSIYTSEKQIQRLLRPGSSYANLNPFSVLLVDYDAGPDEARKQYKKLSILLHPDKNPDNREKAQIAFDVVNKAYRCLDDETSRARALEVVEEAKHKVRQNVEEKRKKLRREGRKDPRVEEDDPGKFKHSVNVLTMKLFADYERKKRLMEDKNAEDRKRKREEEIEEEEKKKEEQEWNKNYEESREVRVSSWKSFQTTAKGKKKTFRPPKHKPEAK